MLQNFDDPVYIHYLCSKCSKIRSNQIELCDDCVDEQRTVSYFIQFPLEPQLRGLYKRPDFVENIKYKSERVKQNIDNIEDLQDGQNYKDATKDKSELDTTLMWNEDGLQVFNSVPFSLHPFYLSVNELPPKQRHRSENILIAGLWGCATKPHPNVFLLPIYQDLKKLKNGVDVEIFGLGNQTVHVESICGTCDSPAKAGMFNQKTHSGFHSCPVCVARGVKPGDSVVFPHEENVPLRNLVQYDEHVSLAVRNRIIITKNIQNEEMSSGIKGPTIFSHMLPNMFSSTSIDSMHAIYLGVMKQIMNLWFHPDFKKCPFSLFDKIKLVNQRLRKLQLPDFLQRIPLNVDKWIHWKASEFRTFMFYLSLGVLDGLLNDVYFKHSSLFVHGVSLLNSLSISEEHLLQSERLLNLFHSEFQQLYGIFHMSFN